MCQIGDGAAEYTARASPPRAINPLLYIGCRQLPAACIAQSKAGFVSKLSIVIEETDETSFWLEFIVDENMLKGHLVALLQDEAKELTAIFIASRKTARLERNGEWTTRH